MDATIGQMANYGHIIFFSLIGGIFSLIGGILLLSHKKTAAVLAKYSTPFAAGALLAAVFLDLFKEGLEESTGQTVLVSALAGIIIFFFLEHFLGWFHHHHEHTDKHRQSSASLIIIGDTMHNALDGVAIAAAFLISVPTGIVTTIAVAAHEIPQEIGDIGLLLAKGMNKSKVLAVNIISALSTTLMALITFALGSEEKLPIGVLLGLSAGFLLYIAMSDIIPAIHESTPRTRFFNLQPIMVVIGLFAVGLSIQVAHGYIEADHENERELACKYIQSNPLPENPMRGISAEEAKCSGVL